MAILIGNVLSIQLVKFIFEILAYMNISIQFETILVTNYLVISTIVSLAIVRFSNLILSNII